MVLSLDEGFLDWVRFMSRVNIGQVLYLSPALDSSPIQWWEW